MYRPIASIMSQVSLLLPSGRSPRAILLSLVCAGSTMLAPAVGKTDVDFDGDGRADVLSIRLAQGESLVWRALLSSTAHGTRERLEAFGEPGDHLIPGYWTSTTTPSIGVLQKRDNDVFWVIRNSNGGSSEIEFGKADDVFVSGGDYNGNKIADAARIQRDGYAYVLTDPFSAGAAKFAMYEMRFPRKAARNGLALFLRRSAQTGDALAVLHRPKPKRKRAKRTNLHLRSIEGTKERIRLGRLFRRAPSGVVPIQLPSGTDGLAVYRSGRGTIVKVLGLDGKVQFRERFRGKGTVLVGDYLPSAGEEIAIESGDDLVFVNPFSGERRQVSPGNGVLADHVNVVSFREKNSGGGNNNGSTPGGGLSSVCSSVREISSGILYKPQSDVSDNRGGKPAVLFTGGNKTGTSELRLYAANGEQVCNFTFKASDNPGVNKGADHYYSGWHGGCSKTGSQIAADAKRVAGNSQIYIQWKGGSCLGPVNPTQRTGGI